VGVNEGLCPVADATGDEEACGVAEDSMGLLDDVCSGGDDEGEGDGDSVGLGVTVLFCGTVIP
jgi:hypothetical protein